MERRSIVTYGGTTAPALGVIGRRSWFGLPPLHRDRVLDRPGPAELVDVFLLRQQELQERLALEAAGLGNGEQEQVLRCHPLEEVAGDLPLHGQLPDRPLGHVVVPGDTVSGEEREQALPVALEPLLVLDDQL